MKENHNPVNNTRVVVEPEPGYAWLYNYYSYLDRLFDGYCVINIDNGEEYISDKICAAIGYSREQLGRTVDELRRFVEVADFEAFAMQVMDMVAGKINDMRAEKTLITSTGQRVPYHVCGTMHHGHIVTIWKRK